jgi:hypothetical protein
MREDLAQRVAEAFALHTMHHNFVKISGAHKMSPAQAAGATPALGN